MAIGLNTNEGNLRCGSRAGTPPRPNAGIPASRKSAFHLGSKDTQPMTRQAAESDFVDRLLAATPTTDLGCAARDILQRQAGLSVGVGETIARQLVSRLNDAAALADAMQTLEKHDNASSRFVQARVLAYRGESARAIDGFQAALQAASVPDADVLLHRAWLLARENRFPEQSPNCGWPCSCSLRMRSSSRARSCSVGSWPPAIGNPAARRNSRSCPVPPRRCWRRSCGRPAFVAV